MIRLIATDMDGTFLNSDKQFDDHFFELFQELQQKSIYFVIASGNQFYHLYNQFLPISDDLYFIAENGAFITHGTKELYSFSMDKKTVLEIMKILERYPEIMPVIGGKKQSYIHQRYQKYQLEIERHYDRYQFIQDISDIDDVILKFSIHDPRHHVEKYVDFIKGELPSHMQIMTSGNEWMDIQDCKINKGFGINFLKKILNINDDECMAFGDQMNDYELLKNVKYACAMDNAVEDIKNIAYEVVQSNDEQGVLKKIENILKEG